MNANYKKIENLFVEIMGETLQNTLDKLRSGEADSRDIRNALTLLKDNGFTLRDIPSDKDPREMVAELVATLPSLPIITEDGEILEED